MNKNDLVESLLKVLSTRKEAKDAVERVFSEITRSLQEGNKVVISNFGSFYPFISKARKGRNPKTGEILHVAPRKKIRFRQAKELFKI